VVEVFEEAEVHDLFQIRIGLILCQERGELDGHLFVSDGRLQLALIGRIQPVDHCLLVLLGAPNSRERHLKVGVEAGDHVLEAK
jgi:hypothetical protein